MSGTRLTVTGAGTIVLAANQAGNTNYSAATQVAESIVVNPAPLAVTVNTVTSVYGAAFPAFTGTITGVVGSDDITAADSTTATPTSRPWEPIRSLQRLRIPIRGWATTR